MAGADGQVKAFNAAGVDTTYKSVGSTASGN